ncbi:MAG: LytR C-terminal domain-containing protein, partial [Acidimicrobiia bacterium]
QVLELLLEEVASTAGLVDDLMEASSGDLTLGRSVVASLAGDEATRITAAQVRPIAALGGSDERYQLTVNEAEALIDVHAPYLRLLEGERPRVEILNGTDRIAVTPPIAARLVRAGFRVVLTDNADRDDYEVSRIVGHTESNQNSALAAYDVLGFGEVRLELRQPSGIVDITVIVGNDFS